MTDRILVLEDSVYSVHFNPKREELEIRPREKKAGSHAGDRWYWRQGKVGYGFFVEDDKYGIMRFYDPDGVLSRRIRDRLRAAGRSLFVPPG